MQRTSPSSPSQVQTDHFLLPLSLSFFCLSVSRPAPLSLPPAFFLRSRGASASILTVSSLSPLLSSPLLWPASIFQWLPGRHSATGCFLWRRRRPVFTRSRARPRRPSAAPAPAPAAARRALGIPIPFRSSIHIAVDDDEDVRTTTWSMYVLYVHQCTGNVTDCKGCVQMGLECHVLGVGIGVAFYNFYKRPTASHYRYVIF